VNGAWGQFKDTEDWRRENAIEELYANIDVDSYDAARRMVSLGPVLNEPVDERIADPGSLYGYSIRNGRVVGTGAVFPFMCSRSSI
jgi:hypothetical protein